MLKNRFLVKWLFLIALIYESFSFLVFAQSLDSTDYFPLHLGDYWYYFHSPFHYFYRTEVSNKEIVNDTTYFLLNNQSYFSFDNIGLYRKDDSGNVYRRIENKDFLFFKMSGKTRDSVIISLKNRNILIKIINANCRWYSDIGYILNCKQFRLFPLPYFSETEKTFTFAPGIGLIEFLSNPLADYDLFIRKANIGGKEFGSFKVSTNFDNLQSPIQVNRAIKIEFNLPVDSIEFIKNFRIISKDGSQIPVSVERPASNIYLITAINGFKYSDTISMLLSGEIKDLYNDKLDGDRNGISEGSPKDDYTITFITEKLSDIQANEISKPIEFRLFQNYPNPFNPTTTIRYSIITIGSNMNIPTRITVYDLLGRKIKDLVNQSIRPGEHSIVWDGKDDMNNTVNSGIYIIQMNYNNQRQTIKSLFLK